MSKIKSIKLFEQLCYVGRHVRTKLNKFERKPLHWSNSKTGKRQISWGQANKPKSEVKRNATKRKERNLTDRSPNNKWRLGVVAWKGCLSARTMLSSLSTSFCDACKWRAWPVVCVCVCVSECICVCFDLATNKKRTKNLQL